MRKLVLVVCFSFTCIVFGQNQNENQLTEIENTEIVPYNKICFQRIKRNKIFGWGGWNTSTGFFIDRNFILTAAHNVHSQFLSNVKEIQIIIGRNGDSQLFKTIKITGKDLVAKYVRTPDKYNLRNRINAKRVFDYAIIYIPDKLLPNDFEWNNEFSLSKQNLTETNDIKVAGYPANKREGYDGSKMFFQKGEIEIKNKYYTHEFQTAGGNSGSPVWVTVKDKNIVLGIHTFSKSGTLIDEENLVVIKRWMDELKNGN